MLLMSIFDEFWQKLYKKSVIRPFCLNYKHYKLTLRNKQQHIAIFFYLKGTVSDILSDALSKDGMPDSQRYPKNLYLIKNLKNNIVF